LGAPISAAAFVNDTLRALLQGLGTESDRIARASTLQALGAQRLDEEIPATDGSPDRRIRALTDALVSGLAFTDGPVLRPDSFDTRIEQVSEQLAVSTECLRRAAIAIRSSRMTCLISHDLSAGRRLARAVCSQIYERYPRQLPWQDEAQFFSLPRPGSGEHMTSPGGWLYRTIASNWRRDEIDPFQPEQVGPASRMPVIAQRGDDWHVFQGTWLVINGAERLSESTIYGLSQALDAGIFQGITPDGRICRIPIPKDFRVCLVAQWEPAFLPNSSPLIRVEGCSDDDIGIERLLAVVSDRMGAPADSASAGGRRQAAHAIFERARWLKLATVCSQSMCETALSYAAVTGGHPMRAAQGGLHAVYEHRLNILPDQVAEYVMGVLNDVDESLMRTLLINLAKAGHLQKGAPLRWLFPTLKLSDTASAKEYSAFFKACADTDFSRSVDSQAGKGA